jgi:phosphoglycolate phosphatase
MIKLVITDLDNTLYNWVDYFVPSFKAMLREMVRLTGVDEGALKNSFKRVYERHRTTEYSFAIEELDVLSKENAGLPLRAVLEKYSPAVKAFQQVRRETLRLYDGVSTTLKELRRQGRKIAAHTDAMMYYAENRLKQLEIEALFDALVAPRDHGLPPRARRGDVRHHTREDKYSAQIPLKRALDPGMLKPNPECLGNIIKTFGVRPTETAYIGDSLQKDIVMAQRSTVYDIYAVYGKRVNPTHYELLMDITHWTTEDVEREQNSLKGPVSPTFTIERFEDTLQVIEAIERQQGS